MKLFRKRQWIGPLALLLAGCQAAAPTGVPTPTAANLVESHRDAMGVPAMVAHRPSVELDQAPMFRLSSVEELNGTELTVSTAAGGQEFVDLAYNGTAKQYLAVWHDYRNGTDGSNADIYGQLLGPDGVAVGGALALSNTADYQYGARVAYNAVANEYLVAWIDTRNGNADLYAQRFTAAGAATGGLLQLTNATSNQELVGLCYHPARNEYLVTWTDDTDGIRTLSATLLSAAGARQGLDVQLASSLSALGGGAIVVNEISGEYNAIWADSRGVGSGVHMQRLSATGTAPTATLALTGAKATLASGGGFEYYSPRIAYNAAGPGVVAVYDRRDTSGGADVFVQRLNNTGALVGAADAVTAAANAQLLPSISVNSSNGTFLVAWSDGRDGSDDLDLYAKSYKADGTVNTAEFLVNGAAGVQAIPALAFDSTKRQWLVSWQDSRAFGTTGYDLYAQRVKSSASTADEIILELQADIDALAASGVTGTAALSAHLNNALSNLCNLGIIQTIAQLTLFIAKVTLMQVQGKISASEASSLIGQANTAIDQINAGLFNCP